MSRTRQQHAPDFKFQVVLEVLREERTVNEIATSHQLHPNLITRWKSEFLESGAKAVFAKSKKVEEADQLKAEFEEKEAKLYQEIGQLTTQLTWLKKKSEGLIIKK
jgi:transposase-like protein